MEDILENAINRIRNRKEPPRCFSAWVQGKGYVNTGDPPHNVDDYWAQALRAAQVESDNIELSPKYAEPGYEQPTRGVLFANWNNLPSSVEEELENAGYAVEWSDEWTTCADCNAALRTQPDSYCWEPSFCQDEDGEYICKTCSPNNEK